MKKILMGAMTMLLVLTMVTPVLAANSPSSDTALDQKAQEWNDKVSNVSALGDNNTIINVTKTKVATSKVTSVNEAAKSVSSQAEVLAMSDLSVPSSVNTSKGIKVTLTIDPRTIKSGYSVYVLHQFADGTWETLKPNSVSADGKVTVTLYSFSPVAVVQYPSSVNVPTSDPSKNQPGGSGSNNNTSSTENNTNSNNTSGPTQSNSNSSNSSNSNSNNQSNNQNNPVNVNQDVTVNYPDSEAGYNNGYSDGYEDGRNSMKGTSATYGSNGGQAYGGTTSAGVLSPKTGAALPALPILAVFAIAGIVVCGNKAYANK